MRIVPLASLLVLVGVLLVFGFLGRSRESASLSQPVGAPSYVRTASTPRPSASAHGDREAIGTEDEVLSAQGALSSAETLLPQREGLLEVHVRTLETGEPLPGLAIHVWGEGSAMDEDLEDLERTGPEGSARFRVPYGRCVVAIRSWVRGLEQTEVLIEDPLERVDFVLSTEGDCELHGRVISAHGGSPVAGARVSVFSLASLDPDAYRTDTCILEDPFRTAMDADPWQTTYSEAGGYFRLRLRSWDSNLIVVQASGMAPAMRVPSVSPERTRAAPLLFTLFPVGELVVRVLRNGEPVGSARVSGRVAPFVPDVSPMDTQEPLEPCFEGRTDSSGRVTFSGLPVDRSLLLGVRSEGVLRGREVRREVALRSDRAETLVEVDVGNGFALRGAVLDSDGVPIPGASVTLAGLGGHAGTTKKAATGKDGRFAIFDLPAGAWTLGAILKGAGYHGERVVVPRTEPVLVVLPPEDLFLEGRAETSGGSPLAEVPVFAFGGDPFCALFSRTNPDGSFRIGPVQPGTYEVYPNRVDEVFARVEARAGQSDILLRGSPPGRIRLRYAPQDGARVCALVSSRGSIYTHNGRLGEDFVFERCPEGRFTVVLRDASRVAIVNDVQVDAGDETLVEMTFAEDAWLELRIDPEAEVESVRVYLEGQLVYQGRAEPVLRSIPVPSGQLRVEARARRQVVSVQDVDVARGQRVRVALRGRDDS